MLINPYGITHYVLKLFTFGSLSTDTKRLRPGIGNLRAAGTNVHVKIFPNAGEHFT